MMSAKDENIQWNVGSLSLCILISIRKSSKSDIRPQVKWADSLVIADGHFNLPQKGFVLWVRDESSDTKW